MMSLLTRHPQPPFFLFLWFMVAGLSLFPLLVMGQNMDPPEEEEIEMLEVIEITGTVVKESARNLNFPSPEIRLHPRASVRELLSLPTFELVKPTSKSSKVFLDATAKTRDLHTPIKPLKTDRPLFPRRARERGWHGRVILRLAISPQGDVQSANIHQSSGHPLLDDSAVKAATQWQFQPAKNGAFPVASIVNIPIQFDLVK